MDVINVIITINKQILHFVDEDLIEYFEHNKKIKSDLCKCDVLQCNCFYNIIYIKY